MNGTSLFLLVVGALILGFLLTFWKFGKPVKLRVIGQSVSISKTTTFSPKYEIISGEYAGVKIDSKIGTSLGSHREGTEVNGLYLPRFDLAESNVSLVFVSFFGLAACVIGLALHFLG